MHQPMLPRDDDTQPMTYDGKSVVLLHSESGTYREWLIHVGDTPYCIVNEGDTWTLMSCVPGVGWCDVPDDVDTFLATNTLILAS